MLGSEVKNFLLSDSNLNGLLFVVDVIIFYSIVFLILCFTFYFISLKYFLNFLINITIYFLNALGIVMLKSFYLFFCKLIESYLIEYFIFFDSIKNGSYFFCFEY